MYEGIEYLIKEIKSGTDYSTIHYFQSTTEGVYRVNSYRVDTKKSQRELTSLNLYRNVQFIETPIKVKSQEFVDELPDSEVSRHVYYIVGMYFIYLAGEWISIVSDNSQYKYIIQRYDIRDGSGNEVRM